MSSPHRSREMWAKIFRDANEACFDAGMSVREAQQNVDYARSTSGIDSACYIKATQELEIAKEKKYQALENWKRDVHDRE